MDVRKLLRGPLLALAAAALPLPAFAQCPGPCLRDAEIEHILRQYSDPIFEAAGLKASDVNIYLMHDPSMNAMAFGGQNMAINTGLILESQTPEMLKGVIAHETGHIAGGHLARMQDSISAGSGVSMISLGLGVLAIAAGAPDAGLALIGSAPQFGILTTIKYIRYEETAADQYALMYLAKTGDSPDGLIDFFEKFRYEELMSESRRQPYFRTHPLNGERISMLRRRAEDLNKTVKPQSQETLDQLAMMKAKLVGYLGPPARVANRYPATDTSLPARYARAYAAYRATDIKKALSETQTLIDDVPENPYFQELYGQILFENGKAKESIPYHRRSVELAPDEPLLMVNLARSLIEVADKPSLEEAEHLLGTAIDKEKDNAFAWNQLSHVYAKQGRIGDADLAVAEEAYSVGNYPRALVFARRASEKLSPDTPNGRRALDIMAMADPRAGRVRGRG